MKSVEPAIPPTENKQDTPPDEYTPSKKRKTEAGPAPKVVLYPVCYEARQGVMFEEFTEQVSKKMRRQAETCEGRQWFQMANDQEASSSRVSPKRQEPTNDQDGMVDQKPPAAG